jgi:acetylornithine deacetylase/succinyl-diaminopimelate desuccinylase-like protein
MSRRRVVFTSLFVLLAFGIGLRGQSPAEVPKVADRADVKSALATVRSTESQTIEDQIRISEIPAPPFKEKARGEEIRRLFLQAALQNVRVDKVGNVLGEYRGAAPRPHVVIAAHLDSVFPEGTNVRVRREGAVLHGPGIGDDSRGLAVLVAMARVLNQTKVQVPGSITFVADVGEEGLGDLRGMKALFDDTLKGQVDRFVTIDGSGLSIAHTFVGSKRYRVTYRGDGGHSFTDFGVPTPISALGRAVARIADLKVPDDPRTTFNVGRIGGGISVNSLPAEAWMEVDLRSANGKALEALDAQFRKTLDAALAAEHARWPGGGRLSMSAEVVGERPAGQLSESAPIVQAAFAATRAVGGLPATAMSSSDANYPASLGIPAIQIGGGGRGGDAHTETEFFDTTDSWRGTQRALLLTIALARQ